MNTERLFGGRRTNAWRSLLFCALFFFTLPAHAQHGDLNQTQKYWQEREAAGNLTAEEKEYLKSARREIYKKKLAEHHTLSKEGYICDYLPRIGKQIT